ncbi:MAG: ATP-binding protein [Meiothermus sp.]|uniref:sensor histidine kinase n=1 Tax=Meiothermus sp. TaxID=1955249 RepID=UPI0025E6EF47|nr:PAS domain-containing sensor histidine kinase [Meiothermus sp.]MCS7067266.1 PAS domain-containing sensor histidine kinase [Meiothermus sp.]MDW8426475.1 ATP-binding protein [Meiothermus sp.]
MQESILEYRREQRIRTILEAIPDDLMLVDTEGNIREYKAGSSHHHLPMDRFLGTTLGELFTPAVTRQLQEAIQAVLNGEPTCVMELNLEGRDFEARIVPMQSDTALILFRDVTTEREAERLKSEFIAAVSHELKTPLASILGFCELLLDDNYSPSEFREYLENIQHSSLRLKDMVNNLLDTSRLEAGRFSISRQPIDLQTTLAQTARSFAGVAKLSQIHFVCEFDPLPILEADPERIEQVVGNLLSNAFKFCPRRGTVWLRARPHGGVLLEVEDTGPGIPLEEQGLLFSRYGRTRSAISRGIVGTGLGLYISKAIVEAHQGRIWVESQEGRGAKFSVWLPLQ